MPVEVRAVGLTGNAKPLPVLVRRAWKFRLREQLLAGLPTSVLGGLKRLLGVRVYRRFEVADREEHFEEPPEILLDLLRVG